MARSIARASRLKAAPRSERAELGLPVITADLRPRIGSSQIDEFVLEHGPKDILRELVQNEFDGGGTEMVIRFGAEAFSVSGSGAPIKHKGWTRLSVIMGTGEVIGDGQGEQIEPKENGIGSKNFGLRALFSYADRILVRSDGQMAILDVRNLVAGVQSDPESRGRAGVLVQAPYRHEPLRKLSPFTAERETEALQEIERALFPTLAKLAVEGAKPGVRRLKVVAERAGLELDWRQTTKTVPCKTRRVSALVRKGRLTRWDSQGAQSAGAHEEIEFSRFVDIPAEHIAQDFPGYYSRGTRVKIAVSLETKSGKLVTGRSGRFYYPLQASQSRTGCSISVSGPFDLNSDRSRLTDSEWNKWLKAQAADLVVDLLGTDWFARFGPAAYETLNALDVEDDVWSFHSLLKVRLASAACWVSRSGRLAKASALVTADEEVLEGHLDDHQELHPQISRSTVVRALALASGMPRFTASSLVVLRCAPQNTSILKTQLVQGEADYRHNAYERDAAGINEQVRTARALSQLQKRLTSANRADLAETASTLSANGELRPATELVLVPQDFWEGCPIPLGDRLHPDLAPHRAVSGRCKPFKLQNWVGEAAARARSGEIADNERAALYRHLTAAETKLSGPVMALVRRSPVLRTAAGEWTAPEDLLWPPVKDQALLALAVPAPAKELRTRSLLQRFRIRRELRGSDLVAVARALPAEAGAFAAFEALLRRNFNLLIPKTVRELQKLAILRARSGRLVEPAQLHLPTPVNLACIDAPDGLVAGDDVTLYRRLGCRETPASAALLDILGTRRERGEPPPHPKQFYPALVEALRAEREPIGAQLHQPILYVDEAYVTPFECLASARAPKCLWAAVPVYRGGVLAEAYQVLGASPFARDQHWTAFFEWIDVRAKRSTTAALTSMERGLLQEAYRRITGPPEGLSDDTKWLLSDRGTVHSLAELRADRFLENDFPELAEGLIAASAPVAFAAVGEAARSLYRQLHLRALSQVCGEGKVTLGLAATAPSWFRADKELELMRGEELAAAVIELAFAHQKQALAFRPSRGVDIRRRIKSIKQIRFVQSVQRTYDFIKRASVAAEAAIDGEALVLRPPSHRYDFLHILAGELAQLAGAKRLPDIRNLVSAFLPLLQANTSAERMAYLKRQGIRLPNEFSDRSDFEDDLHDLGDDLVRGLVEGARDKGPSVGSLPAGPARPSFAKEPTAPTPPPPLPPIEQVLLTVSSPQGVAPPAAASGASGGGGTGRGSVWQPRTPAEMVRDAEVGRRGEELVYQLELERVRSMGRLRPEDDVIWASEAEPGADHDIRSIGDDGQPIWIEVKTTTGTDGRFDWPRREFEKAIREGARYQLWRVYNGASKQPEAKMFPDPIALIKNSRVRLEIGDLRAFVESVLR